jgi:5-methyltetrahydrofolate--homocysteine methyltransferase
MHSTVDAMNPALDLLFQRWKGPVMAYPETSSNHATDEQGTERMSPVQFAQHARRWVNNGVQIIGGCCGTTVDHIRELVENLPDRVGPRPTAPT